MKILIFAILIHFVTSKPQPKADLKCENFGPQYE